MKLHDIQQKDTRQQRERDPQQKHGVHFPNLLEPSVATRATSQRPLIFNVRGCVMDIIKFPIIAVDRNNNKLLFLDILNADQTFSSMSSLLQDLNSDIRTWSEGRGDRTPCTHSLGFAAATVCWKTCGINFALRSSTDVTDKIKFNKEIRLSGYKTSLQEIYFKKTVVTLQELA